MSQADVQLVLDTHAIIGESPTWSVARQALFWIDVKAPAIHRFDLASGSNRSWQLPSEIGCFALSKAGEQAVLGLRSGLFNFDFTNGHLEQIAPPPFDSATHRFNEGSCDPTGRFWLGIMFEPQPGIEASPTPAPLCSYTREEGLRKHAEIARTPNGLAWSPDGATMYFAHTQERTVFTYSFDALSGRLGRPRSFVTIPKEIGVPDGGTIDSEGCYWSAIHGGGRLQRYRPDGRLHREVMLPVKNPTMAAFAGPHLDALYITSASHGKAEEPHAGGVFRLYPGVRGIASAVLAE